ncbi:hypothetical protein PENSTE_c005G04573 [Penicillium steckii]|uniref:Uncharacterized protein n=1 Tax=Penicillium steckii TaxID=303698 RepID=A0A1V6TJT2_9EURO|nr:hypothetical protein PENSTE_c005G04573 [Penicillium steckii]
MQIPTVTLEDLQAFQASHFPGHPQTIIQPGADPTVEDEHYDGEDVDLGYYPDGVKRTLTDEQIEIFRHSEIHALLRKRQLEQDGAEYEARRAKTEDEPREEIRTKDEAPSSTWTSNSKGDVATGDKSRPKSKTTTQPGSHTAGPERLDYGDTDETTADQGFKRGPQVTHTQRKIISYDD